MNEKAIQSAYSLFTQKGYKGDINQFVDLINRNDSALNKAHSIFVENGYKGNTSQFSKLLGVRQPKPSAWQNIKNNLSNAFEMGGDVKEFYGIGTGDKTVKELADEGNLGAYSGLNIASTLVWEGVFGRERMKRFAKNSPNFFKNYNPSDSETFMKIIENFEGEKEDAKRTMSFEEAETFSDYLSVAAGSVVNAGGSVAYNLGTLGTGFFMDFASENFLESNKIKAKSKKKSLEQLLKDDEADVKAPVQIAAFQTGLEMIGLGKILKPLKGAVPKNAGKYLSGVLPYNKTARVGLNLFSTGGTESVTEMGQTALELYNKDLAEAKAKGEDLNDFVSIAKNFVKPESVEAGLQGFFGGAGLRGGSYSAKALSNIRNTVSDIDVEKDLDNLTNLTKKLNETKDEDVIAGIQAKIKNVKASINDKIKKGNDIYGSLNEGDITEIETLGDLADATSFRANQLNKKLDNNEISNQDYKLAMDGLVSNFKDTKNKIRTTINNATVRKQAEALAKEKGVEGKVTEANADQIAEMQLERLSKLNAERDINQSVLDNPNSSKEQKDIAKENIKEFNQQIRDVENADRAFGFIDEKIDDSGKLTGDFEIVLNSDKPMLGTAAHEFMHKVLFKTLKGNKQLQDVVGNALTKFGNKKGIFTEKFANRMAAYINPETGEQVSEFGEEVLTVLSQSIIEGDVKYNENVFTQIGDVVRQALQRVGLIDVKFDTGRDVYNFVKDFNKSIEKNYTSKAITRAAVEGIKGKLLEGDQDVDVDAKTIFSKEASDRVQNLYDNKPTNFEADIIKEFDPIVSRIVDKRREAPNFDRELLTTEIQYGKRGILDLIRKYDPSKGVPLAAYINDNLPKRAIEASRRILGEEFTQDVTERVDIAAEEVAEPTVTTKPKPKKIVLADRLGITKEVAEAINKIVPNLDIDKLTFKTLKNEIPEITGKLFGIPTKKIENLANLTKSELQSAQMFINKNADLLVAMLPEGATASGTATGVPNSLLKAFYTKTSRAKMAKTGTKAGLAIQQKNNIKKTDFLETFGIIDGKPDRTDRNTSARVLALANLTGKMITNQAVRQELGQVDTKVIDAVNRIKDGKSTFMYSKDYVEDVLSKVKLGDINNGNIKNRNLYKTFIKENYPKFVPLARSKKGLPMLHAETFGNTSNIIPGKYITKDERKLLTVPANNTQLKNKIPFNKDQTNAINEVMKKTDFFNQKNFNSKLRKQGAEIFVKGLNEAVNGKEGNINNLKPISMLLVGQSNAGTGHVARTIARGLGISNIGTLSKKEHVLVANNAVDIIVESLAKNNIDLVLPWLLDNYYQINVNAEQDTLIDNAYKNSKTEMPPVFYENFNKAINAKDMSLASDPLIRYTMANVNLTEINWHTGGNLLQQIDNKYGFDGSLSYGNNSETNIRQVNNILSDFFAKRITKNQAKQRVESVSNVEYANEVETGVKIDRAINNARVLSFSKDAKGISILDFDDTLATTKSLVKYTAPDGTVGTLNAEQFASTYEDLQDQGYKFDFSDFNKVVKGKLAPLFQKALKLQKKFGPENMFVLTARPPQAQKAIFDFLKANGLNIPLKNITGLGNSTAEAKALWVADKVADGYNDFYFADDALQNVQAVKNMLDQFDVKSKVQQAKIKFSKDADKTFNDILEKTTGIESVKEFSETQAKIRGKSTKYKSIIPPSAQDFAGLLYSFLGKGRQGEKDFEFFKKSLIDPFARGINELNTARQKAANDLENLNKKFPEVKKKLYKKVKDFQFTNDQAMRVYLWNKAGFEIPGLSKRDLEGLVKIVENDAKLKSYADAVGLISKKENVYKEPKQYWLAENITSDLLDDGAVGDNRALFLQEWQDNVDIIFSDKNLNKIEAIYGSKFKEALGDILYRMQTGRSRPLGGGRLLNMYNNWVNNSVGAIMFFNMRSALLQTISATNYINWHDNNPVKAAAAFANQPQYWKDFTFIFNSDFLKQRRAGNRRGINEQELSAAVAGSDNKAKAAIAWLLSKGFLPTQIADSFAIASGGSTFYRNRIKKYVKEGLDQKTAEKQAFLDFQETTEAAQQSARPDMISQQQASPLGRLILAFQNTPMQYARIINKAARDLNAGRGDYKTHISKIAYYGFIQSVIFSSLQSALFASLGDDEEEEFDKKKMRILNSITDSMLSGIGFGGKAISTTKNTIITFLDQRDRGFRADHAYTILALTSFSPPIGSKLRKVYSSIKTDQYNKDIFLRRGFTLDNPIWQAIGNVVEGVTNVPLGRAANKMLNIDNALDESNEWWQRAALVLGWNTWDLGIRDKDIEELKKEVKKEKRDAKNYENKRKKKEKEIEKLEKEKVVIEKNKKKKDGRCAAISSSGKRCSNKAIKDGLCTIHEKTEKRKSGKKFRCIERKADGTRCKMMTSNKSQLCYYHD